MNEETRNLLIKELTKKSIERGGYILKNDLFAQLKMSESEINKISNEIDDIIAELSDNGIEYHEDEGEYDGDEPTPDVLEEGADLEDDSFLEEDELSDDAHDEYVIPEPSDAPEETHNDDDDDDDYEEDEEEVDNDAPTISSWTAEDEHVGSSE